MINKELKTYVRTESIFPENDQLWQEVKLVLDDITPKDKILAPFEFAQYFPDVDPIQFSYFSDVEDYQVVVLNKAQVELYSDEFLRAVQKEFHYSFGNAVFNVFERNSSTKVGDSSHYYKENTISERLKSSVKSKKRSSTFLKFNFFDRKTVLVVSASKFGNAGDDAITEAAVNIIENSIKGARVILARPPFSRYDVDRADLVVLGGGGVLYDSCFNNAMNYCDYILYASSKGKPTLGIGLGTQGIKSERGRQLYKNTLDLCQLVVVRNRRDQEVLEKDCGVVSPIFTTNDIVFSLGKKIKVERRLRENSKSSRLKIAISLLDSKNLLAAKAMANYRQGCQDSIQFLCENHDVFFVVQSKDDINLYRDYVKKYGAKVVSYDYGNTDRFIDFYKTVDLSITSRFHGYIFSLLANVPIISVGSNAGKIDRLIKAAIPSGSGGYIPLRDFNFNNFEMKFKEFLRCPECFRPRKEEVNDAIDVANDTKQLVKKFVS